MLRSFINLIEKGDHCLQAIKCKKKILAEGMRKVRTGKGMMGSLKYSSQTPNRRPNQRPNRRRKFMSGCKERL
jgi:hypothetical protein